jgi:hypothetical protein
MTDYADHLPPDFAAFCASRRRFLDGLAAESLLRRVEREAAAQEAAMSRPLEIEGDLAVLVGERRLVMDYFETAQRDLADVVREVLGFDDEAFGVGRVGRVLITIERLTPGARAPHVG